MNDILEGVRFATADEAPPAENAMDLNDKWMGENLDPYLSALFDPERYFMIITQVNVKRKVGSIIIPDTAVADQDWTNGLAMIVKVGPSVYRGKRFHDLGLEEEDGFKPGDVIYFNAGGAPRRQWIDKRLFLWVTDDTVMGRANEENRKNLHRIKFTI